MIRKHEVDLARLLDSFRGPPRRVVLHEYLVHQKSKLYLDNQDIQIWF